MHLINSRFEKYIGGVVAFFVNLRGDAFGMPLFTEVLSTIDSVRILIRVKNKTFFVSCLSLFFVGK